MTPINRIDMTRMVWPPCVAPMDWAKSALRYARISDLERFQLGLVAQDVSNRGGDRFHIEDAWRSLGYTEARIPDMYGKTRI